MRSFLSSPVETPSNPPAEFGMSCVTYPIERSIVFCFSADFNQFNAEVPSEEAAAEAPPEQPVAVPSASPPPPPPPPPGEVDPFQAADPFASQSDANVTAENTSWFQPAPSEPAPAAVDPFLPKPEVASPPPVTASPKVKKAAPKANPALKGRLVICLVPEERVWLL